MLNDLRSELAGREWEEGDPPPVVTLDSFFEDNGDEYSIAPNQWGYGRPALATMYQTFKAIAARSDVQAVLVGLHDDWNDEAWAERIPPAENVHIYTSAGQGEVEEWVAELRSDGVIEGWPYGKC